jgi:predicted PurR-regulated permease PerM
MRWLRKIAAILVMILAVLGFLLCVGLLIGSWAANEPASQAVTGSLDMVEQYLNLADNATTRTQETVGSLSQDLAQIEQTIDTMSDEDEDQVSVQIQATVANRLGPYVNLIEGTVNSLSSGVKAVNRTVTSMNRIPGASVPQIGDELDQAAQQLDAVSAGIDDLQASVSGADFDGTKAQNAAATASDSLSTLESTLAAWQSRIDATQQATSYVSANVPRWIDLTSTAVTLLAILFGAGQVALFVAGWNWFKDE